MYPNKPIHGTAISGNGHCKLFHVHKYLPTVKHIAIICINIILGSHITLTKSPDSAVDVKTEVTIKCQTYGVLTADNLLWTIVQSDKGTLNMPKIQQEGDMLILPVNETNRNKVVECYVSGNPQWRDEIKLDVTGITSVFISK